MNLPENYIKKMEKLLGKIEFEQYLESFQQKRVYGLRVNRLKISLDAFLEKKEFSMTSVAWCGEGVYYEEGIRPAKHPYYHGGLYYLQEPSAMSSAAVLPIEEGDNVLDLCAAPGGKSTQLGGKMGNKGVLVANDISPSRTKALLKNIERFGIRNAIVISESPKKLAGRFCGYFDKILIDAPCSGEGMFRKEPDMVKSWKQELLDFCCEQQAEILEQAAGMLKVGGMILYSTCTFSPEENEKSIQDFLNHHDEFEIVPISQEWGFAPGRPDWIDEGCAALAGCARLFPHKIKGEGHFLALLQKKYVEENPENPLFEQEDGDDRIKLFEDFAKENIRAQRDGIYKIYGDDLYILPKKVPTLKGLRVIRSGWYIGTFKKNRFEPSQAFAMGLTKEDVKNTIDFSLADERVIRYLKGETVETDCPKEGWCLVCVDGFPLGWGKVQRGRLKNKYFPGWKWE